MKAVSLYLVILLCTLRAGSVLSEVTIEESLSFGTFTITDNSSVSSIGVDVNNRTSRTNNIHILYSGQAAHLRLSDYPPFTRLFLTPLLPVQSTVFTGATEQFTLAQLDMVESVITDSLGGVSFRVGGTLESSGNGERYLDTTYNLNLVITVNY